MSQSNDNGDDGPAPPGGNPKPRREGWPQDPRRGQRSPNDTPVSEPDAIAPRRGGSALAAPPAEVMPDTGPRSAEVLAPPLAQEPAPNAVDSGSTDETAPPRDIPPDEDFGAPGQDGEVPPAAALTSARAVRRLSRLKGSMMAAPKGEQAAARASASPKQALRDVRARAVAAAKAEGDAAAAPTAPSPARRERLPARPTEPGPQTPTEALPPDRAPALAKASVPARTDAMVAGSAQRMAEGLGALSQLTSAETWMKRGAPKRMTSSRAATLSMTSQEAPIEEHSDDPDVLRIAMTTIMRIASVSWLAATILLWGQLIGVDSSAPAAQWHSIDSAWVAVLVAAIATPIVSVGLWLASSWGAVIWGAALVTAIATDAAIPEAMPFAAVFVVLNGIACVVVYAIMGMRGWRDRETDD